MSSDSMNLYRNVLPGDSSFTEQYSHTSPISFVIPKELKEYRKLSNAYKQKKHEEKPRSDQSFQNWCMDPSDVYPIVDSDDKAVMQNIIRNEELTGNRYGILYASRFNELIVDPVEPTVLQGENSKIFPYERIYPATGKPGVVMAVKYQGKYILLKQYRHALRQDQYSFPRGFSEKSDQSFEDAAVRELEEELNAVIKGEPQYLGNLVSDSGLTGNYTHVYLVEIASYTPVFHHEGIQEILEVTEEELAEMIQKQLINDGFTLGALALLHAANIEKDQQIIDLPEELNTAC